MSISTDDWTIVYDICRRDRASSDDLHSVVLAPSDMGAVTTLEEAFALVRMLQEADAKIGCALRSYTIFPLVKHRDFGLMQDNDTTTLEDLCRPPSQNDRDN